MGGDTLDPYHLNLVTLTAWVSLLLQWTWLGTAVSGYVCLDVSGICSGLCIFLCAHPVSASEDSFPPYHPGQGGPLSSSKAGESGHTQGHHEEGVEQRERWTKTRKDSSWLACPLPVPKPPPPAPQWPGLLAALGNLGKGSAQGLGGGSGAGPELFLP